jgi:hypothetical protein
VDDFFNYVKEDLAPLPALLDTATGQKYDIYYRAT